MICRAACGHRWPADDPEWLAQVLPVGRAHRIWPAQGDDIEWTRNSMAPHDEAPTEFAACAMTLCLQSSRKVRHTVADLVLLGPQDRPTGPIAGVGVISSGAQHLGLWILQYRRWQLSSRLASRAAVARQRRASNDGGIQRPWRAGRRQKRQHAYRRHLQRANPDDHGPAVNRQVVRRVLAMEPGLRRHGSQLTRSRA